MYSLLCYYCYCYYYYYYIRAQCVGHFKTYWNTLQTVNTIDVWGKATIDVGDYGSHVIGIEQKAPPEGCWDSRQSCDVSSKSDQSAAVQRQLWLCPLLPRGLLRWPCNDKVASLAAQWDTALAPIMKYISLLHLRDITLSLLRRNLSGRASFLYITSLPSPLVQTQLFLNESNGVSIMSHPVKHLWNMTASTVQSMAVYSPSLDPQTGVFSGKSKWRTALRVHLWGHIC